MTSQDVRVKDRRWPFFCRSPLGGVNLGFVAPPVFFFLILILLLVAYLLVVDGMKQLFVRHVAAE